MCAECPLARIRFGGSGAGSMRWRVRPVGCRKLRKIRVGGIGSLPDLGLIGGFFTTMSTSWLGYAWVILRRRSIGHSFRGIALGRRVTTTAQYFVA